MFRRFTERARNTLLYAQDEAKKMGQAAIGTEHVLLGLLRDRDSMGSRALLEMGVDFDSLREDIHEFLSVQPQQEGPVFEDLPITPRVKRVFNLAFDEAHQQGVNYVGTEHLLLGLLREEEGVACQVMRVIGVEYREAKEQIRALLGGDERQEIPKEFDRRYESGRTPGTNNRRPRAKSRTPVLDNFGRDLTKEAQEQRLDPVIGREKEIERVVRILSRRTKNNPVLIGDPGVGKTAIIEGLAQRIVDNMVPEILAHKRVVSLDLSGMVAGTKYRGEFEDRLTRMLQEIKNSGEVILFIDELHTIVGAGAAEGAIDAANILKPSLARGEFQCVGATTIQEYRKYVEKDAALERRFQPITVDEPSQEESVAILKGLRDRYEAHHGVKISDDAIEAAVRLSARYISDRFLPDKAIDLIDEAASRVNLAGYVLPEDLKVLERELQAVNSEKENSIKEQNYEKAAHLRDQEKNLKQQIADKRQEWLNQRTLHTGQVTEEDIAEIVSGWSGVPLNKIALDEGQRLLALEQDLHRRVIGQDDAVAAVARAVRRARAGLKSPKKPIGSFIFLGPTGVGKTELARALAESIFGTEDAMIRLDMSEYMEKHTVARMVGAPPGYIGHDEGGQLTEKIRRKPYSVVLLDEIEKAHPDVFNVLLQVLEDGHLTDGQGRTVNCSNTIIIMTSNVGAENLQRSRVMGFSSSTQNGVDYERSRAQVLEQMKDTFRPEFLNRIDEIIVFHHLTEDELARIAEILLEEVKKRAAEQDYRLEISERARKRVLKDGYDPAYGARPLKRAIQRLIEDTVSEALLAGTFQPGDVIQVDTDEDDQMVVRKANESVFQPC